MVTLFKSVQANMRTVAFGLKTVWALFSRSHKYADLQLLDKIISFAICTFFLFSQVSTFVLVHLCNTSAPFHVIGETCSHVYADLELLDISCSFSFSAVVHIFTCALLQYVCSSAIFHIIEGTCSHICICRLVYILNGILNH